MALAMNMASHGISHPSIAVSYAQRVASVIASGVGILVLLGWTLDLSSLKSLHPGFATMKPHTALAFILCGVSLWLLPTDADRRPATTSSHLIGQLCAFVAALLALLTLSRYLFGWQLGADEQLFLDDRGSGGTSLPGRIASASALNLLLLGCALLLLHRATRHGFRTAQWLTLLALLISLLALFGYAYGVEKLYTVATYSSVALHTAITFVVLSIGILLARGNAGLMSVFSRDTVGGVLARRFLPAALFIPFIVGWVSLKAQQAGFFTTEFGVALSALTNIAIFTWVIWRSVRSLDRTDVERKQAEKALRESEARYRLLFESNPLPMWVYDLETLAFLAVNEAAVNRYGHSREDFLTMTIKEIRPTDEASLTDEARIVSERSEAGIWRHRAHDGTVMDVETTAHPVIFAGRPAELVLANDITERKHSEQALRESEERYRSLVLASSQLVWTTDAEGSVTNTTNMESALGQDADLGGWRWVETIHPGDRHRLVHAWTKALRSQIPFESNYRQIHGDGSYHYWIARGVPVFGENGRVREWIGTSNDVTERKLAAESLRERNEELAALTQQFWQASKLAVMGELAASIAHELNNPLATISLRAESLLEQVGEDASKRRALEVIVREIDRMGGLVRNLLQFSRRSHQQISTFDVRKEIDNALEFIHYHLRQHHIKVEREFADSLPTIHADRQQLQQLFLNLLTNASDATRPGGVVTVRVAAAQMENGADSVVIEFADTGAGIAPGDLTKVWEPFFTTKPEGRGTGLGLAICRRIVDEHRGTISIASELGEGSTVRIALPTTN